VVATTRSDQPLSVLGARIKAGELAGAAPVAVAGCFTAGLITGAFYALVPVYGQSSGRSVFEISWYLALAIFGGLLLQVPIGKLSDSFDRRLVAGLVAFVFAGLAVAIRSSAQSHWFLALWLLLGAFMSVIYPVCVAHANGRALLRESPLDEGAGPEMGRGKAFRAREFSLQPRPKCAWPGA